MRHYIVSVRVSLVVVLMALVVMSGMAFAVGVPVSGGNFRLVPNEDGTSTWNQPPDCTHWNLVDDVNRSWSDDKLFIACDTDYDVALFGLTTRTRPGEIAMVHIAGQIGAMGPPGGVGWITFYILKGGGQVMCMGYRSVYTSAGDFVTIGRAPWYGDWTQGELDGARVKMVGMKPRYNESPLTRGAATCDEVGLYFYYWK